MQLQDIKKKYFQKVDFLDLELIIAHIIQKPREFVLTHPEYMPSRAQLAKIGIFIRRRAKREPLAYILGHKGFYGLDFKVTPDTLVPRPETELLVEEALKNLRTTNYEPRTIIDIGTGSGNIIIALAKNIKKKNNFIAIDISKKALRVAKQNAKFHKVDKKIKFIHNNLLDKIKKLDDSIIVANLPYLSKEIYNSTLPNVKKYEPKSALHSSEEGLWHYAELLKQTAKLNPKNCQIFLEISPEQKTKLPKIIKKHLPEAKVEFHRDLAKKWRICRITL